MVIFARPPRRYVLNIMLEFGANAILQIVIGAGYRVYALRQIGCAIFTITVSQHDGFGAKCGPDQIIGCGLLSIRILFHQLGPITVSMIGL